MCVVRVGEERLVGHYQGISGQQRYVVRFFKDREGHETGGSA